MAAPTTVLITHLTGQAWVKGSDGSLTPIREGMRIAADAEIVTATGANVQVQADGAPVVTIGEGQDVALTPDLVSPPHASEAAVTPPTDAAVNDVITAINAGQDQLAQLEPTAATLGGGGGGDHSFVRLSSVIELTSPLALSYPLPSPTHENAILPTAFAVTTEAAPPVEPPPPPVEPPPPPVAPPPPRVEPPPPPVEPPPPPVEPPPPPVEPPPPPEPIPLSYNIALLVDVSRTMGFTPDGFAESRMDYTKAALHQLVDTLSGYQGTVNIGLISFSTGAALVHSVSGLNAGSLQALHDAINSLTPDGATNYEAAFDQTAAWLSGQTAPAPDNHYQNITYFITDGNPTVYNGDTVNFAGSTDYRDVQNALDAFHPLTANGGQVHAIGVGDLVDKQYLGFFDNTNTTGTAGLDINDRTKDGSGETITVPEHINAPVGEPVFVDGAFHLGAPPETALPAPAPAPLMASLSLAGLLDDSSAPGGDSGQAGQGTDSGHGGAGSPAPAPAPGINPGELLQNGGHEGDVSHLLPGASGGAGGAGGTPPTIIGSGGDGGAGGTGGAGGSAGDAIQGLIEQGKHGVDQT